MTAASLLNSGAREPAQPHTCHRESFSLFPNIRKVYSIDMSKRQYLDKLEMPDLPRSELRSLASSHLARLILLKEGPKTRGTFNLTITFLRLADFSIIEYLRSRNALTSFSTKRAVNRFFEGICHLENCIVSMHRSLLFMQQIRRLGLVTHDGAPIVIRSKEWKVLRAQDRLRKIRNSIQHLDGLILRGEEKIVFAFRPGERGLEFESAQLSYAELCQWLRELNQLSKIISSAKES
jgi:hypothetical protein